MKSSVYRRIRTEVARFIDYCRSEENRRISVALLVLITLMSGIQIGDYLSCRKQYIYNDKGELVAFVRVSKDSAESIPLHVSISEGNEKKSKDLVINIKGNKAGDDNNPEKADEGDSLETVINRIASDLSDSSDRIIYFPLREKNARISWEKQKNYSIILIPLLFPLSFAAIRESRKASEKQKKEFKIIENVEDVGYYTFVSIVNNGDAIGSVIIISTDVPITDVEDKMCIILSKLLSNSLPE